MKVRDIEVDDLTANTIQNHIYLPFLHNECSKHTIDRINQFKEKYSGSTKKKNKDYQVLIYGKDRLSDLPPKSKIYVAGLGINLSSASLDRSILEHIPSNQHIYSISGGKKAITIKTIVKRMVEDGLLEANDLNIKLWFADCNNKALLMAEEFAECLQDYKSKNIFTIDYYPHSILHPLSTHGGEKHKWAVDTETRERVRASQVRASLFFDGKTLLEDNATIKQPDIVDSIFDTVASWVPKWG